MAKSLGAWLVILIITTHCTPTHEAQFYQGCSNSTASWKYFNNVEQSQLPFSCISLCIEKRFAFAAIENGINCFCNQSINSLVNNTACGIRCPSSYNLHCGDAYFKSIYSTALPVISATSVNTKSKTIPIKNIFALETTLSISIPWDMVEDLQSIQGMNKSMNNIYITWELDGKFWNDSIQQLKGNSSKTWKNVSFHEPGFHRICVAAKNLVSYRTHCISVEVLLPVSGVHLVDITAKKLLLIDGHNSSLVQVKEPFYVKFAVDKGSSVDFTISFGDGLHPVRISTKDSDSSSMEATCITVPYSYQHCGNYLVQVTVTNAISKVSLPRIRLHAQKRIKYFLDGPNGALPGKPMNITIIPNEKYCSLNYKWKFGDKSPFKTTKEPYVEHVFNKTGSHSVSVQIYNDVSIKEETVFVYIQTPLISVTLSAEGSPASSKFIYKTTPTDIMFHANVIPYFTDMKYIWHFNAKHRSGRVRMHDERFTRAGLYLTYVEVVNKVGSTVRSKTLHVVIEDAVYEVKLKHRGVIVLHQNISFTATVSHGSNLNFLWDFGDGIIQKTKHRQVVHQYKNVGVYNIQVMVYNNVSRKNASKSILVTRIPSCQPPSVKILGWIKFYIYRYEEIHLESQVTLDCSWTDAVLIYKWKIHPIAKGAIKPDTLLIVTSEPILIIPPYTLAYGIYDIVLKVHKNTTILSSEQTVKVEVMQHDLVATIKGGSQRVVGYKSNETILLDGSDSKDPDFPEETKKLRFNWDCHLLNDNTTSCFDPQVKLPLDKPVLNFQVKHLLTGKEALLVTLTVSKEGRKKNMSSTWQILRMVNAQPHLLALHCPQCENGMVNPNDPLVLRGICFTCPWTNQNLTFEWQLYLISKNLSWAPEKCVPGKVIEDDIILKIIQPPVRVEPTQKNVTPITPRPPQSISTRPAFSSRGVTRGRHGSGFTTRRPIGTYRPTKSPSQETKIEKGNVCSRKIATNPIAKPTNCKFVTRWPTYRRSIPTTYWLCPNIGTTNPPRPPYSPGSGSGIRTGRGSVTGTPPFPTSSGNSAANLLPTHPATATTQAPSTATKPTIKVLTPVIGVAGDMYDPGYIVPAADQSHYLLSIDRHLFDMQVSWTNTGLTNRNLVMNKYRLMNGKTYMLALKVKDINPARSEPIRRGMANVFFKVNKNPKVERCSVKPASGFEMETQFRIVCKDGSNKHQPLTYRVRYRIQGDAENHEYLIYTGINMRPSFVMPSGKEDHGYNVSLHISVFNQKDTTVEVCPLLIKVQPTAIENSKISIEEYLLNKTKDDHIKNLIKVGEEQKVKQLINVIAKALNRLKSVKKTSSRHFLRREARAELLKVISKFRIRDMTSAVQSGEALDVITRVKEELNVEQLEVVSQLILDVERQIAKNAASKPDGLSIHLVNLVTRLASNLMSASTHLFNSSSRLVITHKKLQLNALKVVHDVVKTKLKHLTLGEKPLKIIHPSLSALASQSLSLSQSVWKLQNVTFILPPALKKELELSRQTYSSACVGTTMIVYEKNPYAWMETNSLHHTKVSSLVLSTCDGDPIPVQNLQNEIEISLPWIPAQNEEPKSEFTVKWQHLNIHHIYTNKTMTNQSLHVTIQTLSKLDHGFVLQLSVNTNLKDPQDAKMYKSTSGESVHFYLITKDLVNSSGVIRLGIRIKDAALNRIKKILSVSPVNYSISSKWIGCFYWDDDKEAWSTRGCISTTKTTNTVLNCRCNHLTTFVGKSFWTPNPLSVKDLRNISSLKTNFMALALVVCLLAVYIVLFVYCYKLDKRDEQKGGLVYLASVPCRTSYRYKITVETGHWFGCGTTASVVVRLYGEANTSDPIELIANDKALFQRASKDVFLFDSPTDLSPLWKIHVWHYNQGDSPSWYLNRIVVKDMTSNEKWYFDNYRWLAVDEEDGKVDVELIPREKNDNVFLRLYHNTVRYFMDYHLWMSVIGRPSYSRFNRKQRLTCCVSLILSFLCVNAAWFHTISSETKPLQVLGLLDITWETVVCGVVCSLIVVPVNLLWIMIFRYVKPYKRTTKVHPFPHDEPMTETSCLADYSEDTVSILDQTIETLLYLKTLGNKVKWDPSHWNDKTSLDSVFEHFDDEYFGYSNGSLGISSASQTKIPPSPVEGVNFPETSYSSRGTNSQQANVLTKVVRFVPKKNFSLPSYCVCIAWCGCFLTIILSTSVTVWYGFSFGRNKSIIWLQSLSISVFESILISQPIMVLVIPIFTLCTYVISMSSAKVGPIPEEDQVEGPQVSKRSLRSDDMHISLKAALDARRHQRYLKFLKPLNKSALSDVAEKRHVRRVVVDYVRELITTLVLLVLVCVLVSSMYCTCAFSIQNTIHNTILRHPVDGERVERVDLWWKDNKNRIVELLYWRPNEWALRENRTAEIFFKDTSSVLIGRPRIRQYKTTKREVCKNLSSRGWNSTNGTRRCFSQCNIDEGHWSTFELSRTRSDAVDQLKWLTSIGWISLCTKHITIEFVLFSGSTDAYSLVSWEVKGPTSGHPDIRIRVKSMKDTFKDTNYEIFLRICKGIFVVTYVFCLCYEFLCLIRSKSKYFKNIWKYIELCLLLLSSMSLIVYVSWSLSLYSLVREILTKVDDNVFGAGDVVYQKQELLISLYALIIFALLLKLIHLMRIFQFAQRFSCLLWTTSGPLLAFMVIFVLVMTMFSHVGYLLFGSVHFDFKTFSSTFIYACGLFRRQGNGQFVDDFPGHYRTVSFLYVASYMAVLVIVLRGLSMSMFSWSFHITTKKHLQTHIVISYLSNLRRNFHRHKKVEEESEDEEEEDLDEDEIEDKQIIPVEYACDEVEYQMEELLFKMNNLVGEGGLSNLHLSSSSDLLLSSDEYDEDVEYLYRQSEAMEYLKFQALPDIEPGSGYESDQSFCSRSLGSGSQSQEGLTDLEIQRRISKDSSDVTSVDLNSFGPSYSDSAYNNREMQMKELILSQEFNAYDPFRYNADTRNNAEMIPVQSQFLPTKATAKTPKQVYRRHSSSQISSGDSPHLQLAEQKTDSEGLQSSSLASVENRHPNVTKKPIKPKQLHPLTRKPKLRQGEISLDEVPKDYTQLSGRENLSSTSEESERVHRKTSSKKPSYLRTLGLLPKTSIAPVDQDDTLSFRGRFIRNAAFQADVSRSSSMDGPATHDISCSSFERSSKTAYSNSGFSFDEGRRRSSVLSTEFHHPLNVGAAPISPSEPGFEVQDKFEFEVDSELRDDAAPLPGLIGDIAMNSDISTKIISPSSI